MTGAGDDIVNLGGNKHASLLKAAIHLTTTGVGGDFLLIDDSAGSAQTLNINATSYVGTGINVATDGDGITKTTIRTGPQADTVSLVGLTSATVAIDLGAGDDTLLASASQSALIVDGGLGNDHLSGGMQGDLINGGPGQDILVGGRGNDQLFGGPGVDNFTWNPGDASDSIDGGSGGDRLIFNGSNANERIDLSASGTHLRLFRDVANIVMDVTTVEQLDLALLGGADTVTATGLSGTALQAVHLNFAVSTGGGDGAVDTANLNGTDLNDSLRLTQAGSAIRASGFGPVIDLAGLETTDQINVDGGRGIDNLFVSSIVAGQASIASTTETAGNTPLPVEFSATASFDAGKSAGSIAAGNLFGTSTFISNDLVVTDAKANALLILENAGHGNFLPADQLPTGGKSPGSVVLQDFNQDGLIDIAITNSGSGTVGILLNDANGGFQAATTFAAGHRPGLLRAADLNQDGHFDLLIITSGNTFSVLSGNGDGTFDAPVKHSTGGDGPTDLAIADFNGDGRVDVAVANSKSNAIAVLATKPDFSLEAPAIVRVGTKPIALATGDFDGDGRADPAVTHGVSRFVSILLSSDAGVNSPFGPKIKLTHAPANSIAVDDVNEDGRADLVVGDNSGSVSVFLNLGGASFQLPRILDLGNLPPRRVSGLVLADFNSDGHLDIATANAGTADLSVLTQTPV